MTWHVLPAALREGETELESGIARKQDLPQFYAGRTVRLPLKDPVYQ